MKYKFLNIFLDQKELLAKSGSATSSSINPFLLENNSNQIEELYNFYKSDASLLYVNGFSGTGKAKIVDYSLAFLSTETIILKYNCFNSSVLDDILLSFYSEFKNLVAQNTISEPKIKTENFTQKVNSFFTQIEKPFVIILNSFEAILEENRKEILDFILHLDAISKIKIIIIGKIFEGKCFSGVEIQRISTFALEKPLFEKYLKSEKIKFSNVLLEEFYKHTRGYYFFTALSIKLMNSQKLSLSDFLDKLKDSYLSFPAFLEKQLSTLIPASTRNLFWFLSMIRHSISIDLLKVLNFYDAEQIDFLIEFMIISQEGNLLYVQDFFKEQVDYSTAPNIAHKIHQYIIDLYQTQLPLKPLERNILISRQTMRKEIEYQALFLPKRPKNVDSSGVSISYLSYSRGLDFEDRKKAGDLKNEQKNQSSGIDLTQRKNIHINLENLPFQNQEKLITPYSEEKENIVEDIENLDLKGLIKLIKRDELNYHYASVIDLCKKALLLDKDEKYQTYLPMIYAKIAHAYQKIADYENALNYYNLAQELYQKAGKVVKANYVKLNISKIYYDTYKFDISREMLLEIIAERNNSPLIRTKAYLRLADLEENLSNPDAAFNYYRTAINSSDSSLDSKTLSELYFKYALALDDKNDVKTAIEFYNKCIGLTDNSDSIGNKFLSSAYSNTATLYLEKNDTEGAVTNYTHAYEIDKKGKNMEGMYYSASKLASILQRKHPDEALEYFTTALDCAKVIKDAFYIVSASLGLGDYYYDRKQNELALKHYIFAFDLAKNNFSQDNINKINVRINDIKFRMGVEKFENLVKIIEEQEHE